MDPASGIGLGCGVTSLAFDVFDHSVKLFKFFCSMVDMPKDYEGCRVRFVMEYNRLLAWGYTAGLIECPSGSHLAASLGTNAVELCSVVARIGALLDDFKELFARWNNDTMPSDKEMAVLIAEEIDVVAEVSTLASLYKSGMGERKGLKGRKGLKDRNIVKWMAKATDTAKDILSHPRRVRWVVMDGAAFEALLTDLHRLTERLRELMGDHEIRQIREVTAKTFREMVVVRNDLREIKTVLHAIVTAGQLSAGGWDSTCSEDENQTLRELLQLKRFKCISDEVSLQIKQNACLDVKDSLGGVITVSGCDAVTFEGSFSSHAAKTPTRHDPRRPRGTFVQNGKQHEVWIEWRMTDDSMPGSSEEKESWVRTWTLAQMLSEDKPKGLFAPPCMAFVDYRHLKNKVGWVFEMPHGSNENTILKTLHSMLGQKRYRPSMVQRFSLSWKVASSLLYLHTADWLHKGIHSGNVVFACEQDNVDFDSPILSGFEYSRPQSSGTTSRGTDPRWDIYRWPSIQSEAPKTTSSRKTYDIYSLGLMLLEIAHWKPLCDFVCLESWPLPTLQDCQIRGWLLGELKHEPFEENPLLALRDVAGDQYFEVTRRCLVAHGELGMRVGENAVDSDPIVGVELQNTFSELVVDKLQILSASI
ncbi:hypothetical protein M409DRAFT_67692 [Zasmidium cellare ATCC 36951]|uniref:Prion-inhibition and propagation HeLo domain-containing protein n=1 Tax=Zasmidium cellare ATCC 36951 TaxID=1080233 RepID=A0A6A6CBE9_ZASCE|nr:uncharacterized protein M409DRAFT_67692 [Zasmidium cellare ATCC 36951]KAF2164527.1 hypothetical protein M409DRAFT_67692 [Zasmidium cellare ATCC 36951]